MLPESFPFIRLFYYLTTYNQAEKKSGLILTSFFRIGHLLANNITNYAEIEVWESLSNHFYIDMNLKNAEL